VDCCFAPCPCAYPDYGGGSRDIRSNESPGSPFRFLGPLSLGVAAEKRLFVLFCCYHQLHEAN